MNIVFLDSATLGDTDLAPIRALGSLTCYDSTEPCDVVQRLTGAEVCITNKVRITRSHLAKLPNLRLICEAATGTDNIDTEAALEFGVKVKNVASYSTQSVVQTTIALYMALAQNIAGMDRYCRTAYSTSGMFTCHDFPFSDLGGRTWAVIGMGSIGRGVAAVATALGAEVIYYSTTGRNTQVTEYECVQNLEALLRRADVLSIHCPLNERTRGLVGAPQLAMMKPEAIVINVARGGIVDEAALVSALEHGIIAGAGLDVFSAEPLQAGNPLLCGKLPEGKLLLTPHIAWTSRQARRRLVQEIAKNICQYQKN